jgi:hypothetical protein
MASESSFQSQFSCLTGVTGRTGASRASRKTHKDLIRGVAFKKDDLNEINEENSADGQGNDFESFINDSGIEEANMKIKHRYTEDGWKN